MSTRGNEANKSGKKQEPVQVILNNLVQYDQSSKYRETEVGTGQRNTLNANTEEYEINDTNIK